MIKLLLAVSLAAFLACCTTPTNQTYEGENHPFRVAMRDMKAPVKVIEAFTTDASRIKDAAKAAQELKVLCMSTAQMKPEFLTPDQHADYVKHFNNMIAVIDAHEAAFKSGDVKKSQGLFAAIDKVKKEGHKQFMKQAKSQRGAE